MAAAPQILSRAALPSLTHSLDASDVLECYHLTRHAPLHLNLTNAVTPILVPKNAIGLRYNSGPKGQMELTLEYGPQRLGSNQEEEALPSLQESFVSWQNEAKIYYSTSVAPLEWESAHYMASITGVVLERLLQKAVDYPRKRYQPFVALIMTDNDTDDIDGNNKIVLKSSSDLDFINFLWESLATLGVSLHPLLPPRQYEARLYASDISKLASGQVIVSVDNNNNNDRKNSTVGQEAFLFFQKLQTCVSAIATAQDPPTQEPTGMPTSTNEPTGMPTSVVTMTTTSTNEPTTTPTVTSAPTVVEPIIDGNDDQLLDDNDLGDDDADKNGADQKLNADQNNATTDDNDDDDVDNNDDHDTIENDKGETDGDDDSAVDDDDANRDQVDNPNDDDSTQGGTFRFRFLSSWQQYMFPQSQEPRLVEDGSVVDNNVDVDNNQTWGGNNSNATIPPNEAQVASEAAQQAKEAAKEAKEAATTEADAKVADAAEAAANAAQKAANVTFQKQKQVMQQNLLSGNGNAISTALRECFTNPRYQLSNGSGTAPVYLYLDGATYYRLNLIAPYLDVALVERPIPQAHTFATSAGGGEDFIDFTLALGTIGFFLVFLVLMLQRAGYRIFQPLYEMQKWYFSPSEIHDSDEENVPIGQGYEHAFGEDVIPLSMGGRRPMYVVQKRGQVVPVFLESSNDDHSGDLEMVDSALTPRRSPDKSGHDLGFGPSGMDMHALPDRLSRDPELVDLPNLSSGSKVAVPVSIQRQRSRTQSRELGDVSDDDSVASESR